MTKYMYCETSQSAGEGERSKDPVFPHRSSAAVPPPSRTSANQEYAAALTSPWNGPLSHHARALSGPQSAHRIAIDEIFLRIPRLTILKSSVLSNLVFATFLGFSRPFCGVSTAFRSLVSCVSINRNILVKQLY
ncbi:hypothetical protein L596_015126 [Steinernema carpocapsae]|uniref:Uncharacterized protein n=1 Tax=Steinernema carpocapsae TaxID=34508 RepID=A0A4V6A306_STECR|nr:hypothetical protein L596_015126 [Steinernema carpocapsae]